MRSFRHLALCNMFQHIEFRAPSDSFFSSGEYKSKWVSVETATVDQAEVIAGGSTGQWTNVPLVIPSTAPSRLQGCSIINVNYALKVVVHGHRQK